MWTSLMCYSLPLIFMQLRDLGVKTLWGEPSTMASNCKKSDFDIIVDNNGKTLETVQPVIDWAKVGPYTLFEHGIISHAQIRHLLREC